MGTKLFAVGKTRGIQLHSLGKAASRCATAILAGAALATHAAVITVDSAADDIFPDSTGALFDFAGSPVAPPASPKCTLRMAIAAANLNTAIGGANGCPAGAASPTIDVIQFGALFGTTQTITLANKLTAAVPPSYSLSGAGVPSTLVASESLTITGPGSSLLTVDGASPGSGNLRTLLLSDGSSTALSTFSVTGIKLVRGRTLDGGGGCMFSSDNLSLNDVVFEACESVGGATNIGIGGALGAGNTDIAFRPNVSLQNVKFLSNRALRGSNAAFSLGGAAFIGSGTRYVGAVSLTNVQAIGNSAEAVGAIQVQRAASVSVADSVVASNSATGDYSAANASNGRFGGMRVFDVTGNVTISQSGFVSNYAQVERGGLSIVTVTGTTTITDTSFVGNVARNGRIGGFEILSRFGPVSNLCDGTTGGNVSLSNVFVEKNIAPISTGGFRILCAGDVSLTNVEAVSNEASGGPAYGVFAAGGSTAAFFIGAVGNSVGAVTMSNVRIIGNRSFSYESAPSVLVGGFTIANVTDAASLSADKLIVRDNQVQRGESGISLRANSAARSYVVTQSEFTGNISENGHGPFDTAGDGQYTLRNSTVAHNLMFGNGGAIHANVHTNTTNGIAFTLENVTSARNRGNFSEAFYVNTFVSSGVPNGSNSTVTVKNSILGGRTFPSPTDSAQVESIIGTFVSTNNVVESTGGGKNFCSGAGVVCNVDAKIENAATLDPQVTKTMALRPGSPALDAGNSAGVAAFDQRGTGFPRVIGSAVDIGAFESPALTAVLPCKLDMDGDSQTTATKEGLVLLRSMLGFTAAAAVANTGILQSNWEAVRANLNANCGTNLP